MGQDRLYVVFVTAPDETSGRNLARFMVENKLAACVNMVDGVKSVYWWEGRVTEDDEVLLVAKVPEKVLKEFTVRVSKEHPYSVPEIVALAVHDGYRPYLDWALQEATGRGA